MGKTVCGRRINRSFYRLEREKIGTRLTVDRGMIFSLLLLAQLPPIALWMVFHGSGISDGTPPSDFVAHWAWALPHLLLAVTTLLSIRMVLSKSSFPKSRD
ncbi:hypothetical protein SAMN05444955_11456 [Lihuaxuella thermophila]|uniref:Uncharacterized protein n=1 Tax=Lihuaxuella thermophila TaxID=1173111 RepID=A0A1H8HJ04_9BACL|nr:hypothetical protein SAMN05444955_11456 [Lihuaxuella thermophila]